MNFFKDVIDDKITRLGYLGALGIELMSLFFVLLFYNRLPPFIPIFNQMPWGEQRLGTTTAIFLPILIAFLILLFNFFLSALTYKKQSLVSRMIGLTSFSVSVIVFLFILKTIQLVF